MEAKVVNLQDYLQPKQSEKLPQNPFQNLAVVDSEYIGYGFDVVIRHMESDYTPLYPKTPDAVQFSESLEYIVKYFLEKIYRYNLIEQDSRDEFFSESNVYSLYLFFGCAKDVEQDLFKYLISEVFLPNLTYLTKWYENVLPADAGLNPGASSGWIELGLSYYQKLPLWVENLLRTKISEFFNL